MDTYICITGSLCNSPETSTTLLIRKHPNIKSFFLKFNDVYLHYRNYIKRKVILQTLFLIPVLHLTIFFYAVKVICVCLCNGNTL